MMSDLRRGDKLALPNQTEHYWEVLDTCSHAGTIHVFDSDKREARYVDEAGIRAGLSNGSLILRRQGKPRVNVAAQYEASELHANVCHLHDVLRRIDAIQRKLDLSFDAAISRARENYTKENSNNSEAIKFPSRATLYRAHKNQLLGLPVLKGDKNKGNATSRYSKELRDFIDQAILDKYLVPGSQWTLSNFTDYINREARRQLLLNAKHDISQKFVYRAIQIQSVDAEGDRMDPLTRVAGKSFAKKRIRAALPFARIEQDAVHLPFVVRTLHGVARTVYLVLAIDVCTAYPVGWHLTLGAPREMDSLLCLEMYLTPAKAARFKELGIAHALNVYGTPLQVIFDNGPETKGGRIVRLELLGIDVKHCKAREAQGKPFIERLNRSLKEALERLPGCTRFEGKDGKRDPEALGDELMTIGDLEKWVVRWLYESWVNTPLERLRWDELLVDTVRGKTALERLRYLTEEMGHPITMPPSRQEWMTALYEHKTCTLSAKTGITLEHGFRFKGDAMSYLLSKYGDHAQLHVVYNPDDFRHAYVYESDELPLVTLTHEHVRADSPAWTFAEAKARLDADMEDWAHPIAKVQFLQDMDDAVTAKSRKSTRKAKTRGKREENQETVRRAKDYSAVARTFERPLSSAAPFGPAPSSNPSLSPQEHLPAVINYDDAPLMTIVNRTTGEKLL
ncbi:integrase catalytic domain-containing protein [Rhodoferax fermentans]|uniref:Transposase n=1 Tax=Rhodoferax fermentans TaxID=28066 RepID=A0A1T1ASN5_RHOFE|nr:DDE-type integrase/transposase/recombinase [Rhodoferax fermentans]MBK1684209.1 transposase [Rhodoferax fermentans]OOV07077.1 transposase [Rhodoferax fermentans]